MTLTIERDGEEIEVEVEYDFYRASRGARDSYGAQLEPDEGASVEITSTVNTETGQEIELTDSETEKAIEQALDEHASYDRED